jgi:uncharacterized protein (DUF927 family)
MAIKHFCDNCGDEITAINEARSVFKKTQYSYLKGKNGKIEFEVRTGAGYNEVTGDSDDGEWCKYCVLDAVRSLDDRPVCEPHK